MVVVPFHRAERPRARRAEGAVVLLLLLLARASLGAETLRDAPVAWYADDCRPIENVPEERDPSLVWDYVNEGFVRPLGYYLHPVRNVRRLTVPFGGEREKPSPNVNVLGEVPNSTWFTNRIGLFPLSPREVAKGPGQGEGPSRAGAWTIVAAKTQGVTPGFTIRDIEGDLYLIKFDPSAYPGMTTAAGVIAGRILHAAGYNVPEDEVVYFDPGRLVLGEDVSLALQDGSRRAMTRADVDAILENVHREEDGSYRAISSHFLSGRPLGPFDFEGHRGDDPNDTVEHHHRRELRGLEVFASWLNHFDTKQHNTLDMLVEEDGRRFVKHYLIDFASTLGSGADGPAQRFGWELTLDPKAFVRRSVTLGLQEDDWRHSRRPEGLEEIAYFEAEHYDPMGFEPIQPNPAFQRITTADGYWAAKIVSAFTDEHLRAIVDEARYSDPRAAEYMTATLAARRDKIARAWFDRIAPLDFFRYENGTLRYRDLGRERGVYPGATPRYRTRVAAVDAERRPETWGDWVVSGLTELEVGREMESGGAGRERDFVAVECSVDRGDGWSAPVTVYLARASGRVVAVERERN